MSKFRILPIVALLLAITPLQSCKKKGCTDNLAENYESKAKKDDGSCTYAATKFFGTYTSTKSCTYEPNSTFTMTISEGPEKNQVLISNFGDFGLTLRATVNGGNLTFKDNDQDATFEGTGYIVGNNLTLNFEVCETFYYPCSDPDVCIATGTK
eukprot:GDKH01002527.1.p1 GENE.GDKH01002527.1~~GDKH01002527.1.p1  ORF type:complete len:154 (-),score=2.32 GDKH01002527.1:25-486(-)